jgi:hypothetical protein
MLWMRFIPTNLDGIWLSQWKVNMFLLYAVDVNFVHFVCKQNIKKLIIFLSSKQTRDWIEIVTKLSMSQVLQLDLWVKSRAVNLVHTQLKKISSICMSWAKPCLTSSNLTRLQPYTAIRDYVCVCSWMHSSNCFYKKEY